MKRLLITLCLIVCTYTISVSQNACNKRIERHLRIAGDSWGHFPVLYLAYDSALAKYGFADYVASGAGSVLISMTAETWWQFPLTRHALEGAIYSDRGHPVDVVMVSLGGNDVAFGINSTDSLSVLDDDLYQAKLFMDSIFDYIHTTLPKAQIIWQSYDYPNFNDPCMDFPWDPYCDLWHNHGYATPYQINRFMNYITHYQDSVVEAYHKPYMHSFNANGLMQWCYGQTTPLRYAPFGTYPPRSVPFPGGNINYPSPHPAMGLYGVDTYHLSPLGYTYLAEYYMRVFINNYLRRNRDTSFYSVGQTEDGYVKQNGTVGTGEIQIANSTISKTKGIISFNTASIPDNKIIKKASLYMRNTFIQRAYSYYGSKFPDYFKLDIKQGTFGTNQVEASDYNEAPSLSDVACVAGNLRGSGYSLRFDLHDDALKFINKTGTTQFRLEILDTNFVKFYNGDTMALESPYLDIQYDTTNVVLGVKNIIKTEKLSVYPNPTYAYLNIEIPESVNKQNQSLYITDIKGALVKVVQLDKHKNKLEINVSDLAANEYFIRLSDDSADWIGSFIKN
ncbi:MAG: T9SS type A sorting domain-containing protein [Chitinophagales bacterium]